MPDAIPEPAVPGPSMPDLRADGPTTPTSTDPAPSRRGLLHGVTAIGVMAAGVGSVGLLAHAALADPAEAAVQHRGHKHRGHKGGHKHHKPTSKPTVKPTTKPTVQPTVQPTTKPTTRPTTKPTSTVTPEPPPPVLSPSALVDDPSGRHLVSRFGYGVNPDLAAQVQAAGGAGAWFTQQLTPDSVADGAADATAAWWPSLARTPLDLWQREKAGTEYGWQVMQSYERWLLMRRMLTRRTVLEVMTEFWENHLNVPVAGDGVYTWRADYGATVRSHALGRFADLLGAAITHPAMLVYLDAAISTKAHPNENLGRELLELHTVGRGNYTEDDVKASARILTGWHVDEWNTWAATYRTADHYVGPVQVMGFQDPNGSADGQALTLRYLTYLARHPATARRIATKLAVRFCSDSPSDALVDSLAATYLDHDTDIRPVLTALVASPEFAAAAGVKVRMPCEDVVATYRALGVQIQAPAAPVPDDHVVNAVLWQCAGLGAEPHNWPQPNGAPTDSASWSSPSRMIASLSMHWEMSGGWWPHTGVTYRTAADWLPAPAVRLDNLVEHLSQQILVRHATPGLLTACLQATGYGPAEVITATHPLVRWNFARLLTTLLDSPAHLTR